mmetsp:Transcript_52339/g.105132  ORF Transcript_52339/g.105132 Transcript_52339/m.105132 type:complete len:198 (-) Transcript_52339:155-748(-)
MERSTLYDNVKAAKVMVDGKEEVVEIDPLRGPLEELEDGGKRLADLEVLMVKGGRLEPSYAQRYRSWADRTSTEQEILVNTIAKKNRRVKEKRKAGLKAQPELPDFLAKYFTPSGQTPGMAWEDWGSTQRENYVFNMMNNFGEDPEVAEARRKAEAEAKAEAKAAEAAKKAQQGPPWMQQDWGWMPVPDPSALVLGK